MVVVIGSTFIGAGIALFRKKNMFGRAFGTISVVLGVIFIGLDLMIMAKKNGAI